MPKEMNSVLSQLWNYCSRTVLCMALGALALAPAAHAKAEKTAAVKGVAAKTKTKAKAASDDDDTPVRRASSKTAKVAAPKASRHAMQAKASDDDEKPSSRKAAGKVAKKELVQNRNGKAVKPRNKQENDEDDVPVARKGKAAVKTADARQTARPMTKAQRLEAEKQVKLAAAEQERQERLEAQRQQKLQAARKARLAAAEEARQQRLQEQAREQRIAKERAQEQNRLATEQAERGSGVRMLNQPEPAVAAAALPELPPPANSAIASHRMAALPAPAAVPPMAAQFPAQPMVRAPALAAQAQSQGFPVASAVVRIAPPVAAEPLRVASVERPAVIRVSVPARDNLGQIQGLSAGSASAPLDLNSSVAYVMDQSTGEVLLNKNGSYVTPIASISKLMTAVVTMDANLPMDEMITIEDADVDYLKGSRSRLSVGATLTRQEMLHLALMASENRAAHALGRTYPGGMAAFVRAMNARALALGMRDTRYVEPTGLSSANQSSARDLAQLVKVAYRYPLIRNYTTYPGAEFPVNGRMVHFNNTNRLVHSLDWNIGLQKTGYISEAGRCVVMQSNIGGRNVVIVLLDSRNSHSRVEDAESIRYWVEGGAAGSRPVGSGVRVIAHAGVVRIY